MRKSVNKFREERAGHLRNIIKILSDTLGRPLKVLDVGGQAPYWENVGTDNIDKIILLNYNNNWLEKPVPKCIPEEIFERRAGDARNLSDYGDKSVDLLHSNSVIEHVGSWTDIVSMASEVMRVSVGLDGFRPQLGNFPWSHIFARLLCIGLGVLCKRV